VAKKTLKPLTKTVQSQGGIPGSVAICRLIEDFSLGRISLEAVLNRLRRDEQIRGEHVTVALGIRSAQQLLERMRDAPGSVRDVPFALAVQYCIAVVEANLFDCASDLIGTRFPDINDSQEFEGRVIGAMMPGIEAIAQQLVIDASAKTLKQPRSVFRRTRRRTGDLLHESLT
jgi:hypothetical protein